MPRIPKRPGRKHRVSRRAPPGSAPGLLRLDPEFTPPKITVMGYGPDVVEEVAIPRPEDIPALRGKWPVMWINVDGLGDVSTLGALAEQFGLHRLAMEDAVQLYQRAKVEEYEDNVFVIARMPAVEGGYTEQLSLFLGQDFVLTLQETEGDCFDPVRERIRQGKGRMRKAGPDYLTYALLDAVIDSYFPVLEKASETLEALEEEVLATPSRLIASRIHDIKRDLMGLRRAIWPHREAINALQREGVPLVTAETCVYLRDCYDHTVQLIDLTESYREVSSDLMGLYLSNLSNRMNEVMKVLTIIATIFIPLSFIAGVYGMNFNPARSPYNMPELNWFYGYPFALGLMVAVAMVLLLIIWKRRWFQ